MDKTFKEDGKTIREDNEVGKVYTYNELSVSVFSTDWLGKIRTGNIVLGIKVILRTTVLSHSNFVTLNK